MEFNITISWSRVPVEIHIVAQLVTKFPAFYGNGVYKSPLLIHILSEMNPIHILIFCFILTYCHSCKSLPNGLFPLGSKTEVLYGCLAPPMHDVCPSHLINLNLITVTVFGEEYNL
jgi:hypothetical protein